MASLRDEYTDRRYATNARGRDRQPWLKPMATIMASLRDEYTDRRYATNARGDRFHAWRRQTTMADAVLTFLHPE